MIIGGRCRLGQLAHRDELAFDDITAFGQNGQNGRRVQKPIDHVNDAIGRYNIGAGQGHVLVAQQDLTLETRT